MNLPELSNDVFGELYLPSEEGIHPAVVVLHGSGGMRPVYLEEGQSLADAGYVALVLDYYTGIENKGYTQERRLENWNAWMARVKEAVDYLRGLPEVDGERIALAGFSQGATLAVHTATDIGDVAAIVSYFGPKTDGWYISGHIGYEPESLDELYENLPPIILLHGNMDPIVPVGSSRAMHEELETRGKIVELHVYKGGMHAFNDAEAGMGASDEVIEDAHAKVIAFLDRYLRGEKE